MAGNFNEITHIKKRRFLNAFAKLGGVRRASDASGVDWVSHYHWLRDDEQYVAAFREAEMMAGDVLENAAVSRAVDGVAEPVYQRGQLVGHVQKYSDGLLQFLIKGAKPEKYAERRDITTAGKELRISIGNSDAI